MKPIYVALDFPTWDESLTFLESNQLQGVPVKIGMELFYREGIHVIEQLKLRNHPIFLDLKLHDIPTTVMRAMRNLAKLDVDIVNVHALGGNDMIKKAKEGLQSASNSQHVTKLIAVTVLTSMDQNGLSQLNVDETILDYTLRLSKLSKDSGADGVVCSVHEVEKIKQKCGNTFLTVTPGIRLSSSNADDQKRIATPAFARSMNTDAIVVGRSITKAKDPLKAYEEVVKEWNNGITK